MTRSTNPDVVEDEMDDDSSEWASPSEEYSPANAQDANDAEGA